MNVQQRLILALACGALLAGCARSTAPGLPADMETALAIRDVVESGVESSGGATASLGDPTGWATLAGTIRINGAPPARSPLTVDKDTTVCAPGGAQILDELLVVGPDNGIRDVLIYLTSKVPTDDPRWEHESYAQTKFAEVEFDQKQCIFLAHVFAMRSTQKLRLLNSDPVGHNTNIQPRRGANPFNQTIPANGSVLYEPGGESPDPFSVSCSIHPWMSAKMITRDSPYFAVTDASGKFEIANVPAGVPLEFRVWQEKASYLQSVTVDGAPQKWSKGRFTITLNPDERREMQVVVDASAFQ